MNRTSVSAVMIAALTAAALAGCTSAPAPSTTATTPVPTTAAAAGSASAVHNDADITFVQSMIPHHTQAVAMSQLVAGHTTNPKITALATQIAQAQGPEITQMQGFLQSWNVPAAPNSGMGGMAGTGSGASSTPGMTPGMMSDQQMSQLGTTSGAAFDRMFLQMITAHHSGAITMAQTELRDGASPEGKALAQKIIDAQQAEITTMNPLLTTT